ncbi:hypothetical protein BIV57_02520 [Mangrovactinospora gilvigrisea]|uniref:Uncharacterized protein n=1 Tax=Mangrovactinospora gilvigrisea TaxID=1428644 RepID=A0A1J7CBW7_9ACTN|nr:hypothetical protein BIV57_02520 [Mangrovactinospora gilvigrisea]
MRGVLLLAGVAAIAAAQLPYQAGIRGADSRPIDLRAAAGALGARARPGDDVLFLSDRMRLAALTYPEDFAAVHDVMLALPAARSATLTGTEHRTVPPLRAPRVWLLVRRMTDADAAAARTPAGRAKYAALRRDGYRFAAEWPLNGAVLQEYTRRA